MEEKEIEQLELTEKTVPKAVGYLINEVAEMRATLDKMEKQLGLDNTYLSVYPPSITSEVPVTICETSDI